MVKLGKRKITELAATNKKKLAVYTESDQKSENEVSLLADDENNSKKEANKDSNESGSKRAKSQQDSSDSIESDDQPLNGNKSSTSSATPGARKKQLIKATPKATPKQGKAQPEKNATSGKRDNRKSAAAATPPQEENEEVENDEGKQEEEIGGDDEGEFEVCFCLESKPKMHFSKLTENSHLVQRLRRLSVTNRSVGNLSIWSAGRAMDRMMTVGSRDPN